MPKALAIGAALIIVALGACYWRSRRMVTAAPGAVGNAYLSASGSPDQVFDNRATLPVVNASGWSDTLAKLGIGKLTPYEKSNLAPAGASGWWVE